MGNAPVPPDRPPDWDADSPQLHANLRRVEQQVREDATRPLLELGAALALHWQTQMMRDLHTEKPEFVGCFRGSSDATNRNAVVGSRRGSPFARVKHELDAFDLALQERVSLLDEALDESGGKLDAEFLESVIQVCTWAHGEWVRIHPFGNGNGRTARMWANLVAQRYGFPAFIFTRPRPGDGYGAIGAAAMDGNWRAAVPLFRTLMAEALSL